MRLGQGRWAEEEEEEGDRGGGLMVEGGGDGCVGGLVVGVEVW